MMSDRTQEAPDCARCSRPMRLASMESNPTCVFAPPFAHFECPCGAQLMIAPRRDFAFRADPHAGADLPLAA